MGVQAGAQPSEQDSSEPTPTELVEEVSVRLVQITIFATDKDGKPVTDLQRGELKLKDGGKKVEVAFLDLRTTIESTDVTARLFVDAPGGPVHPVSTFRGEPRFYVVLCTTTPRRARPAPASH